MVFMLRHYKKCNYLRTTYQALLKTDFNRVPFLPQIDDDMNPEENKINGTSCTPLGKGVSPTKKQAGCGRSKKGDSAAGK